MLSRIVLIENLRHFWQDRRGTIAAIVGFSIIPLVAVLGLATDTARGYMVQSRMSQAVDAAALAGGRAFTEDYREEEVDKYFRANFPDGYMGIPAADVTISKTFDDEAGTVTVTAAAAVDTTFMRVLHFDNINVSARGVVNRAVKGLEAALVLDVTGSMGHEDSNGVVKLESLKVAVGDLLDAVYGNNDTIENVWMSVVPFASRVNIQPNTDWVSPDPGSWYGCADIRSGAGANDDTTPGSAPFSEYTASSSGCPDYPTLPLTAERTTIEAIVDDLNDAGNTRTDEGIIWGWRSLSPLWRGVWATEDTTLPLDYNEDQMEKAIVIITDGENRPVSEQAAADQRLADACIAIKANDIKIYTVVFDITAGSSIDLLFEACATSPSDHYRSPTGEELKAAFKAIGAKLSNLRLSE